MRLDVRWVALTLCLPFAVARAATDNDYAYAFPLDTKEAAEAYRVVLSPEVCASVNPSAGLHDLVVVNALNRPVPFGELPPSPPPRHDFSLDARLLPVPVNAATHEGVQIERNTSGGIVISQPPNNPSPQHPRQWLVDAGRAVTLDHLELDASTLKQDFQAHLAVDASNDLRQWMPLSGDIGVTRVHGESDQVEQLSLPLSGSMAGRYYRIRLIDGDVDWSDDHVPSVQLAGSYTDAIADRLSQLQWLQATHTGSNGNDYDYTLPASLPLEAVKVQLPAANTAARVHLQGSQGEGASAWFDIATLDLVRTAGKDGDAQSPFAARNLQHLRLHSETPLAAAPVLSVGWLPPQYFFMAEGGGPYRLLAGSYASRRGEYPVTEAWNRLRARYGEEWAPPVATIGSRVDEVGAEALKAPKVPYDWTRPLLWGVLVVGALAVAGMALSLLRQARREDTGP
ncbi:DUF3999 family protein [Dyella jiangningensis]|uniref:DUF3999 domain-containing protein n=1 Tax=Dyella jiangningensis TaxID=1379159 RepID=A0A328PD56_9GAMM|nr:DUF3999 family protein [Dyella jiangningensis]RAO78045.1 hypothetical protein CA260_09515 [Dyella jiangningensis]